MLIKDLPSNEKPRERLIASGAGALSTTELLAIILGSGCSGMNVLDLALELTRKKGIENLFSSNYDELKEIRGIGKAKACLIVACGELFRRVKSGSLGANPKVNSAMEAASLCEDIRQQGREHLVGLYLNSRHRLIKKEVISVGNMDSNIVDPKEVFKPALLCNARCVILVHNHPSGDPEPSDEDIEITKIVAQAGELLNLKLLDHIIMGSGGFISLCERSLMPTKKSIN